MPSLKIVKSGERKPFSVVSCCLSGIWGILLATALLFLLSVLFLLADVDTKYIPCAAKIILFVAAFFSGVICGKRQRESGYLYGACSGLLYACILLVIGILSGIKQSLGFISVLTIFLCAISGAVGGIFGINLKKHKKTKRNA